jgi:hypothetical protein
MNNNTSENKNLAEIEESYEQYADLIVTDQQVNLIKSINDELEDLFDEIYKLRHLDEIYPLELDQIVNGSFENQDLVEILLEIGCDYSEELTTLESVKTKYDLLKNINENIMKHNELKLLNQPN